MPDIKISDLTAATAASGAMQLEVNDSLSSKKVTVDQIKDYVLPDGSVSSAKLATGAVTLTTKVSGVLPVTNGGSGVSTSTGSGNNVLSNSPTLVSPALGTPASGNLANCTFPTLNQNTTGTAANVTGVVAVANGGTGTATPSLVAGTGVSISGSFPNQTINAAVSGVLNNVQYFTASGTYTATAGTSFVVVQLVAGGSSGNRTSTTPNAGGTSSFGTLLSATGGSGSSGGTATGGSINVTGGNGSTTPISGGTVMGGFSGMGVIGSGGSGTPATKSNGGVSGGAGGFSQELITTGFSGVTVTVGAGGGSVTGGGAGRDGIVIVYEYK